MPRSFPRGLAPFPKAAGPLFAEPLRPADFMNTAFLSPPPDAAGHEMER